MMMKTFGEERTSGVFLGAELGGDPDRIDRDDLNVVALNGEALLFEGLVGDRLHLSVQGGREVELERERVCQIMTIRGKD